MKSSLQANEKRAICGICPAGCWVIVSYDQHGKLDKVRADDTSPLGMICPLGEHSSDIVYSEHRLRHPMRRKGPKGTHVFERISWDDAYNIICKNLNQIKNESGPEATAIYTGRGSFELSMCDIYQPKGVAVSSASSVLFPFGSPNTLGVGALCYVSFAMIAPHVTMGGMLINMFSDIENAELIVVWGANPATDSPPLDFQRICAARDRGAEVVVIDPRRTKTAKATDAKWIPVRPGTDGALALGLCNVLIEEELYDAEFALNWTIGFDDFTQYVQHYRPEIVENMCGVPADEIKNLARRIAEANGAVPVMYTGLEYSNSGVQAIRATMVLWALAGQLDVPGGRCFSMKENVFPVNRDGLVANPDKQKALGLDRFPVYSSYRGESHAIALPQSVLEGNPYKIRALIILGGSIITAWPQPQIWKKTFETLDFMVCIDRQLTADSAYADIVLPATTMYEINSYMTYGALFRLREKIVEPVGEARNDYFILAELADRLGYGHLYPQNEEELLNYVLKNSGFSVDDLKNNDGIVQKKTKIMQYKKWEKGLLRKDGKPGFETPSGKFEIASSILQEHGYDALPVYTEPIEGPLSQPALHTNYPLVFNSGSRVSTNFRSQHHGIAKLARKHRGPFVTMNTADAKERNITSGDMVRISNAHGKVTMRAFVTDDIVKGAIDADMGGGGPVGSKSWQQTNINELTDLNNYDPISGFPVYKALLCEIEKVAVGQMSSHIEEQTDKKFSRTSRKKENLKRIYLDHNATTMIDKEVQRTINHIVSKEFGNPSSIYAEGKNAKTIIESARRSVARLINCTARRIIFTGCGSEANNMAIKGIAFSQFNTKKHIITSQIEHPSVINTCKWLENMGFKITYLPVDKYGCIKPEYLEDALTDDTFLVSIMLANNETGSVQPVAELVDITKKHNIIFHTDAVQAVSKIPVDVEQIGVDLLSLSGHKFYGPKGIGALYIRKGIDPEPLISGGKQENAIRAGTENIIGIAGLGKASDLAVQRLAKMNKTAALRDNLEKHIKEMVKDCKINGHPTNRVPVTLNVTLPEMRGESIVLALDQRGISLSSGSACRAGSPKPSHALLAMGLTEEQAHCTIRISLGYHTTKKDIDYTVQALKEVINDSRTMVRFVPCR